MPSLIYSEADAVKLHQAACAYFEEMSKELSELAYRNGLESLTVIFEMAREEAERIRLASDEHLDRP
jgi:hypothetical protein